MQCHVTRRLRAFTVTFHIAFLVVWTGGLLDIRSRLPKYNVSVIMKSCSLFWLMSVRQFSQQRRNYILVTETEFKCPNFSKQVSLWTRVELMLAVLRLKFGHFEVPTTKTYILIFRDKKNLSARKRYIRFLVYLKEVIWDWKEKKSIFWHLIVKSLVFHRF